jgi:hypothetical protein
MRDRWKSICPSCFDGGRAHARALSVHWYARGIVERFHRTGKTTWKEATLGSSPAAPDGWPASAGHAGLRVGRCVPRFRSQFGVPNADPQEDPNPLPRNFPWPVARRNPRRCQREFRAGCSNQYRLANRSSPRREATGWLSEEDKAGLCCSTLAQANGIARRHGGDDPRHVAGVEHGRQSSARHRS